MKLRFVPYEITPESEHYFENLQKFMEVTHKIHAFAKQEFEAAGFTEHIKVGHGRDYDKDKHRRFEANAWPDILYVTYGVKF